MLICWAIHEVTAVWDVVFAHDKREIKPVEQWVHGYLALLPLLSLVLVVVLNWSQFLALFGLGTEAARSEIVLREPPLAVGLCAVDHCHPADRGYREWPANRAPTLPSTAAPRAA